MVWSQQHTTGHLFAGILPLVYSIAPGQAMGDWSYIAQPSRPLVPCPTLQ